MEIKTEAGTLDYEPCFCVRCGSRVGWQNIELGEFCGLCDDCAAIVSQDNSEDPTCC